jgi:hypothetical protein
MLTTVEISGARSADRGTSSIAASIENLGQPGFDVAFREYLLFCQRQLDFDTVVESN